MSKEHWKKHENVEGDILDILRHGEIMTTNVILFELKKLKHNISYNAVARRLESLTEEERVFVLDSLSKQKLFRIKNF